MIIKGYKIFNPNWTCRDKQYTCPGEFIEDVDPIVCERGMHFCPRIMDCLEYYSLDVAIDYDKFVKNKVAIVQADTDDCDMGYGYNRGRVLYGDKYAASRLKIVTELSDDEIIEEITIEMSSAFSIELKALINNLTYRPLHPIMPSSLTQKVLRIAEKLYAERVTIPTITKERS